jgi:heme exporter protein C
MTFTQLANPARFQAFAGGILPFLWWVAGLLLAAGLVLALVLSPADYQQGDSVRIMYVHVPAAWLSLLGYSVMAGASAWGFIARHPLADAAAKAAAPVGAVFTALALLTGSLWGKPMWGAFWVWDARLTSELILLFLYLGYIALWSAIEEPQRAAKAAGLLAIAGFINVPIVHFSVNWWNTLHQPASVFRMGGPTIDTAMLAPLFIMALGFTVLFAALVLLRLKTEILERRLRTLQLQAAGAA